MQHNPIPSLLRELMSQHLDPGYASVARDRASGHVRSTLLGRSLWLAVAGVIVGLVFGIAGAQASARAPDSENIRNALVYDVRSARDRADTLARSRAELDAAATQARRQALAGDAAGQELLDRLTELQVAAAGEQMTGPALTVTLTDPSLRRNLSDSTQIGSEPVKAVVLDRDIQAVVNALWACGAEGISVGGVRIGPSVTVRQAGGAMLVDNQPISSPYAISALGNARALETQFVVSHAYLRMSNVEQLYDVGFEVAAQDSVTIPAAAARPIRSAEEEGPG